MTPSARNVSWNNELRGDFLCDSKRRDDGGRRSIARDQAGITYSGPYGQQRKNLDPSRMQDAEAEKQEKITTKRKPATRHQQRERKRAREAETTASAAEQYRHPRTLQLIAGDASVLPKANNSVVPWEHRGILGMRAGEGA